MFATFGKSLVPYVMFIKLLSTIGLIIAFLKFQSGSALLYLYFFWRHEWLSVNFYYWLALFHYGTFSPSYHHILFRACSDWFRAVLRGGLCVFIGALCRIPLTWGPSHEEHLFYIFFTFNYSRPTYPGHYLVLVQHLELLRFYVRPVLGVNETIAVVQYRRE